MGKFKVNGLVKDKDGKQGKIRCIERVYDKETKHTKVKYFVQYGEGLENWKEQDRKDLTKVYQLKTYKKSTSYSTHTSTYSDFKYYIQYAYNRKELKVAVAVCHPDDNYDKDFAYKITNHRLKHNPKWHFKSEGRYGFTDDNVEKILNEIIIPEVEKEIESRKNKA